jgi:hypothetical protein
MRIEAWVSAAAYLRQRQGLERECVLKECFANSSRTESATSAAKDAFHDRVFPVLLSRALNQSRLFKHPSEALCSGRG